MTRRSTVFAAGAVIFDLDGTLTRPILDFDRIREEIGLPHGPILELVMQLPPEEQARAEAILLRHEAAAAADSELQPGAGEVVAAIRGAGIPIALMTRNSRKSTRAFQRRHGLAFDLVRTREDGPIKPSPEPVVSICSALGAEPSLTWVVGDFHFDLKCANAAGAISVLLIDPRQDRPAWAREARHVIGELRELLDLMRVRG
jgi:HAD superfamily hydrolase (TIGR01509 family)